MAGLEGIAQNNKALTSIYEDRKKILEKYQSQPIDYLRSNYKDLMNENDRNISTLNRAIGAMETLKSKADKLFQDGFTILDNTKNIDNEIIAELNKSRIGTLQGLTRQTIKEDEIKPAIYDQVAQEVVKQDYKERADINRLQNENTGGRKRKTNKKTNKKSKKNKYKKSKKNKYQY
jgi:hypothetical protein